MTSKLADKVAVVIGGSAGIGLGIAKRFANEGARVFITGRRKGQPDEAVASIGGDAAAIRGDAANLADLDRIFAQIQSQAGRIDALAVSAGVYEFGTFGEITEEHFDKAFNTNVRGLLFTVQKALPLLTRGSSVILIGSMVSIKGFAACSVYNASKAAIRSFARTWIVDLKGRDIRINVLSPGYTDTPGLSDFVTDREKAEMVASVPPRSHWELWSRFHRYRRLYIAPCSTRTESFTYHYCDSDACYNPYSITGDLKKAGHSYTLEYMALEDIMNFPNLQERRKSSLDLSNC